jgi:hypothetical protein
MVYPIAMIMAITLVVAVLMICQEETSVGPPRRTRSRVRS